MSELIKHECGIAMIRLLKPAEYYHEKYGTALYGLDQLSLLMQKMRNRGQDGAGVITVKLDMPAGQRYLSRYRSIANNPTKDIMQRIKKNHIDRIPDDKQRDYAWQKEHIAFTGEVLMGHLRYGTHGRNTMETCHPFIRQSNFLHRTLTMAGNFNLTNVDELFKLLVEIGQNPKEKSDTVTVLEKIGHFLDREVDRLTQYFRGDGLTEREILHQVINSLDIQKLLSRACKDFDGGFVMGGIIGHGDAFMVRDPRGIRPGFYYADDEVVVAASERPAIMTAFDLLVEDVKPIPPGHALIIKKSGQVEVKQIFDNLPEQKSCSFERIYFSRGNDHHIYDERKKLGYQLAKPIAEAVKYDFKRTVFSYVPNTAESAYFGMIQGIEDELNDWKVGKIRKFEGNLDNKKLRRLLARKPRVEKMIIKDAKQRTFITQDSARNKMVSHAYDVTYGVIKSFKDTLVLLDDSIVRGTTLKKSIIRIASRLQPKKIIIVSSAPQIRFPDCYGIDMSKMKDFIAFQALLNLLERDGKADELLEETYNRCLVDFEKPTRDSRNEVKWLYDLYDYEDISQEISRIVTPDDIEPEVQVIYQTVEGLHKALPDSHHGDWYFTGDYPTAGGNRVANRAFVNFMEKKDVRAY